MNICEKVSYVKGLAEGMKLDGSTNEGKVLLAILDVLNDIAYQLEEMDADLNDMAEVVGDLEESVGDLEEDIYGDDEHDHHCGCGCEDEDMYEITCPKCENSIVMDFDVIASGEARCPNCGELLEFELDGLEDEEE